MSIKEFNKLSYKMKALILLGNEECNLNDIGLSWLSTENDDKKTIVKTVNIKTNGEYSISFKNNKNNIVNSIKNKLPIINKKLSTIIIGCISKNIFQKIEVKNISIKPESREVKTLNLILKEDYSLSENSHFEAEIEKQEEMQFDIDYWRVFSNKEKRIEALATPDRIEDFGSKNAFINWYKDKPKICCYCGVKESDLTIYFNKENEQYKDARQRGAHLEIERIVTAPKEKNKYFPLNTELACYICNNAKSDFLSPLSFKPIAKGIHEFWCNVLKPKEVTFPEDSKIWEKK